MTPVTVASQEMRSVQPLSNSVQETLLSGHVCPPGICVPTLSMHSIGTGVVAVSMRGKEEVMGNQCERYDGMLSVESQLCRSNPYSRGAISTPAEADLSGQRHEGMRGDMENHENGQRSEFVASAIPSHVSARGHAIDVDYVEGVEESVVRPRSVIIPRTPENLAPFQRRRGKVRFNNHPIGATNAWLRMKRLPVTIRARSPKRQRVGTKGDEKCPERTFGIKSVEGCRQSHVNF